MSAYVRRFTTDPGVDVLLEIESVNILDLEPPASISGVGTGVACLVGEFENGPFDTPTEVASADEMMNVFGMLGYTVDGVECEYPCAVARKADSALSNENWNGNGFVQLNGKKFKRLVLVRVDTSVGTVQFTRIPYLTGAAGFSYDLEPAQTVAVKIDGAGAVTATFDAAAATVTGAAATYAMVGGETIVLGYDAMPDFTVTFQSTDTTAALCRDRINLFAGFAFATVSGGQIQLTGRQRGTGGQVRIVSQTNNAHTKLGLTIANTAGTGDVANIDAVTFAEAKTLIEADIAGTRVERAPDGKIRICAPSATTSIEVTTASTADAFGFPEGTVATATSGTAGKIPAGTVVENVAGTVTVVTMQDIDVTADSKGPYSVKVRHAVDDGTEATAAGVATMTKMITPVSIDAFTVTNASALSIALTESQIDALYLTALDSTLDDSSVASDVNLIWSARQSNAVRRALKENAINASADGLAGRMAMVRPPLGTLKSFAKSTTAEPGVGAYRTDRVVYCYPGVNTYVPKIAKRGTDGGTGFTADGNVDIGADGFMASVLSQMNPEQNPGEANAFLDWVNSIESTFTETLGMNDYKAFKASGIAAIRISKGAASFQSGVTSVDPAVTPSLKNIHRRRMADYIEDTLALRATAFSKKLNTAARRKAIEGEIRTWLSQLLSKNEPQNQRIAGYTVDAKSGNTPELLAMGLFKIIVKVRVLSTLESIVIAATVGENVEVEELLAA